MIIFHKKKKISIVSLIFLCIITAIIVVGFSLSKFESNLKISGTAQVAIMANDVYAELENNIQGYPGCEPCIYEITITNKEDNKICDVAQKYAVLIEREEITNLPLEFSLFEDEKCTKALIPNTNGYYEEESFVFDAKVEQIKKLYLKVDWPVSSKNPLNAFEIDYFRVLVKASQIN